MEVATVLAGAAIPVVNLWAVQDAYLAKELYAAGAGDYAAVDTAGSHQLLIERIENLLANKTAQFLERHKERAGSERDAT